MKKAVDIAGCAAQLMQLTNGPVTLREQTKNTTATGT